jgi:CubicO group peptidase (beta-lactamase class C family)
MGFVYWKKSICLFASLVLACAIVIWSTAHAQTDSANDKLLRADADIKKITQRLEPLLPTLMKDECVPGMTIGLIDNGELVWVRGFGVRDLRSNERVTKKTVFEAASLGKPAFSYAVLRMSERGEINIDKPLYEYLRRDYVENDSRIRLITARMVLSHTSGFRVFGRQILFQPGEKFL